MGRYVKKPVEIEAFQLPTEKGEDLTPFEKWAELHEMHDYGYGRYGMILIETLEGTMAASPGDWIIKGVEGEFYPCKPEIFKKTYSPVALNATATSSVTISREGAEYSRKAVAMLNFQFPVGKTEAAQRHEKELESVTGKHECSSTCCPTGCARKDPTFYCQECGGMLNEFSECGKCKSTTGGQRQ